MATFNADQVRACAIEVQQKARKLYQAVLPVYTTTGGWTLNALDPRLPAPYDVKVQLAAYKALQWDALKLADWIATILTALPEDTLEYSTPPADAGATGQFDGSATFDGSTTFNGE